MTTPAGNLMDGSVLVVSDDPRIAAEAKSGFPTEMGVTVVGDARTASVEMSRRAPKVVVVDIQSGSAGGFGLLKDMSQDHRFADIPSLMLVERVQDSWLARQAGASLVRRKPLALADLISDAIGLIET